MASIGYVEKMPWHKMDKREPLLLCDCPIPVTGELGPYNCEVMKLSLRHFQRPGYIVKTAHYTVSVRTETATVL